VARILIVEDHLKDFRIAEETARGVGFSEIELRGDINTRRYLETAAESGLPDAILLDLDLGMDSGYEMLRIRYETPQLRSIPVVVFGRTLARKTTKFVPFSTSPVSSQSGKAPPRCAIFWPNFMPSSTLSKSAFDAERQAAGLWFALRVGYRSFRRRERWHAERV
jgi:CheY-like chemotaxis protein